ncbi:hypothetical protein B0T25DRAFT_602305 [Lasiosphaeria hispida]|uniref:Galactose oxidase n=1 Tax=Lasiosphaeria hispida TaxID=260671 RepID=A0AAJ0HSP3_9PEZI|nr:hypothetical protein B0T25DRAFT_602305 [Lasiosphaeria hispida]
MPVYQSECAHPRIRGFIADLTQQFIGVGFIVSTWVGYGSAHAEGTLAAFQWRFPLAVQAIPAARLAAGIMFFPESPRHPWVRHPPRLPTPRGGIAAAAVGEKIYTFGGEGNPNSEIGVYNETEVYDTVKNTWDQLPVMPLPRHGTSAVAIGGKVFIPGGGLKIGADPVDSFDVYRPC